jgi:hypothetical protein
LMCMDGFGRLYPFHHTLISGEDDVDCYVGIHDRF